MTDHNRSTWNAETARPSIEHPVHYYQRQPQNPQVQQWDEQWQQRTNNPRGPQRPGLLKRLMKFVLVLGTVFLTLFLTAGVAFALVGQDMLDDWYLEQEPFEQEVWCNRFETYLQSSYLCDLRDEASRPDNPFVPTIVPDDNSINPDDLLLTPLFDADAPANDADPAGGAPQNATTAPPTAISAQTATPIAQAPTATQTPLPTTTPTATLPPTATVQPTLPAPPADARLDLNRITPEFQQWNNCGPTTLTMGMTYFGYGYDQSPAATYLKPNREDKNVSPWQMVSYVNNQATDFGARALYRVGGDIDLLKRLIAAGFPVIIEKGYEPEGYDWMGHYLLMVGYDDRQQIFYTFDSFLGSNSGQGRRETYAYTETYWRHFNNTFIVIYQPAQEATLMSILGQHANESTATQIALERARAQANANPNDQWAWFNMGDAFARLGQYNEAASAFERAFSLQMPWRTLWYLFTPFETYYHLGRYGEVRQLSDSLDRSSQNYVEEAWYYRGLAYAAEGRYDLAAQNFERVLRFNRNFAPAQEALNQVQNGTFSPPAS